MNNDQPVLKLQHINKTYDALNQTKGTTVLHDISLEVQSAQTLAITGPSGSGKSTLLNIMSALDHPTSGQIWFDDKNVSELNDTELATLRNLHIGFVFQSHFLLPQCTAIENVILPTLAGHTQSSKKELESRALYLLEQVDLQDHRFHRPAQLSGGQCQRVALVRALINQPKLLLADEPTGSLDRSNAQNLIDLLVQLNDQEKTTLIIVSHDLDVARRMQHHYRLEDGQLFPDRLAP